MESIERINNPSLELFREKYLRANKPVIITGFTETWPAYSKWSAEFLSNLSAQRLLNVSSMVNGEYVDSKDKKMTMKDYLHYLREHADSNEKLYLGELSISQYLPELLDDIKIPDYFDKTEDSPQCFLYMGQSLFSQLHFHNCGSATLSPMHGYKKVRLYPPDQTKYLSKYPWYSKNHNMSKTTTLNPDRTKFPAFSKAKYIDVKLSKGEMLFIPIYWWHAITNEDFNIAVVTFWGEKHFRRMPPFPFLMDYLYEVTKESPEIIAAIFKKTKRLFRLA